MKKINIKRNTKATTKWLIRSGVLLLVTALMLSSTATAAAIEPSSAKDEVVYAMLKDDGAVNGMYAVNSFDKSGNIVDYGDYSAVRNMSTGDKITQTGDKVTVTNTGGQLYYEGTLKKTELPWKFSIAYYLNGHEYPASEIAGKSGALTIKMNITKNPDCPDCNGTFYKNYALQATLTLDSGKSKNIVANGATIVDAGGNKQLTYTILPNKGANITITANVTNFTMDAITINGIRLNLNVQVDDAALLQKVNTLKSSVNTLDGGANDVNSGASDIKNGTDQLASGANDLKTGSANLDNGVQSLKSGIDQVQTGLNNLNSKSSSLTSGSAQVKSALTKIQTSLASVKVTSAQIGTLVSASSDIKKGINGIYSGIDSLKANVGYAQYKAAMSANGLDIDELQAGNTSTIATLNSEIATLTATYNTIKNSPDPAVQAQAAQLKTLIDQLTNVVLLLKGDSAAIGGTETYLNNVAASIAQLDTAAAELNSQYATFDAEIAKLGNTLSGMLINMTSLSNGINELVTQYSALDKGINDYTNGVAQIVAGYSGVVDGVNTLATGSKNLADGSNTLYTSTTDLVNGASKLYGGTTDLKNGTGTFKQKTANLNTDVNNQINDILSKLTGDKSAPVSFVSSKNTNVQSVQFVMKTNAIEAPQADNTTEKAAPTLTEWQKFLKLFGLYHG